MPTYKRDYAGTLNRMAGRYDLSPGELAIPLQVSPAEARRWLRGNFGGHSATTVSLRIHSGVQEYGRYREERIALLQEEKGYTWQEAHAEVSAPDSEFNRRYRAVVKDKFDEAAHGKFAEFLDYIGLREESDLDVGKY